MRSVERSEEHTSELQSPCNLVCRLLLEKKKTNLDVTFAYFHNLMNACLVLTCMSATNLDVASATLPNWLNSSMDLICFSFFFLNDPPPAEINPFPPHDPLPI